MCHTHYFTRDVSDHVQKDLDLHDLGMVLKSWLLNIVLYKTDVSRKLGQLTHRAYTKQLLLSDFLEQISRLSVSMSGLEQHLRAFGLLYTLDTLIATLTEWLLEMWVLHQIQNASMYVRMYDARIKF